ncbi:MAG: Hpt domain-containing protein [Planctomycetota bacterium]
MSSPSSPLRSVYAEDQEFGDLIQLFVAELPERIATIDQTLADQDLSGLRSIAHQLKGAGGGYGFTEITDAGRKLERLAETADAEVQEDIDRVTAAAKELVDLCHRATAD